MCFSLAWFEQILIWLVIVCAVIAILKLLVPFVLSQIGAELGGAMTIIMAVIKIVIWAIITIFVIVICFELIQCLLGQGGGLSFPRR